MAFRQNDWGKVLAEVVGTFFFFFIGIGSIAAAGEIGVLYVALAHGVALAVAISALGHISGAHFNPAITVAMLVTRRISPLLGLLYVLAQIVGGVLACLLLVAVLPSETWRAFNLGTPGLSPSITTLQAILLEAILTFFLVLAVFGTAVDDRGKGVAGFGIGLTVFVDILVGGPLTGGVMNPARAIAPALVSGTLNADQLVYWIGPPLGAVLAAVLYTVLFLPQEKRTDGARQEVEPPVSEPGLLEDGGR